MSLSFFVLFRRRVSFGFDSSKSFVVPSEVADFYSAVAERGAKKEQEFNALFATYEVIRKPKIENIIRNAGASVETCLLVRVCWTTKYV